MKIKKFIAQFLIASMGLQGLMQVFPAELCGFLTLFFAVIAVRECFFRVTYVAAVIPGLWRLLLLGLFFVAAPTSFAATRTWDGGAANPLFSTPANWDGDIAPADDDSVVFNAGASPCSVGTTTPALGAITFTTDYTGYFSFRTGTVCTLIVKGNATFQSGGDIVPNSGRIEFVGTDLQTVIPKSGDTLPDIIQNGSGGAIFTTNDLTAGRLMLQSGELSLGTGRAHQVTFVSGPGAIDFLNSTLKASGDSVNFSAISSFAQKTGTFVLNGASPQAFIPHPTDSLYNFTQNGSATATIYQNPVRVANNFNMVSGTLNLGSGLTHFAYSLQSSGGALVFGNSTLRIIGPSADFTNTDVTGTRQGTLAFAYTGGNTTFKPRAGSTFPNIFQNTIGRTTTVTTCGFRCQDLALNAGTFNLGNFTDTIRNIWGTGSLTFGGSACSLRVYGDTADFGWTVALTSGTGTIDFISDTGTQVFTPKFNVDHPFIIHNKAGKLRLQQNALKTLGFTQGGGTLDINGLGITTVSNGDFIVNNGTITTFANLAGASIISARHCRFSGQLGNLLNLNPASAWTVTVTAGELSADYADLANSQASITGSAIRSNNLGGNVNWDFANGKRWTNIGGDNKWSTATNWSNDALPAPTDTVVFYSVYNSNCILDVDDTVGALIAMPGYGGNFDFNGHKLSVFGRADFRGIATVSPGLGRLEFVGSNTHDFTPDSGSTMPAVIQNGAGTTNLLLYSMPSESTLTINQGQFNLGTDLTHTFKGIDGAGGSIAFGSSTLKLIGRTADFRNIAVDGGTGTLRFAATAVGVNQAFYPRAGATYYNIVDSTYRLDTVKVLSNGFYLSNNLVHTCGGLDLGSGLSHSVLNFTTGDSARLVLNSSAISVRDTVDLRKIKTLNAGTGTLILAYNGGGTTEFHLKSGLTFYQINRAGSGTVRLRDAGFTIGYFYVNSGTFHMDSSKTIAVTGEVAGPGDLNFYKSILNFSGATLDITSFSSLVAGSGTLQFSGVTPNTTVLIPKSGNTLPAINHSGTGTLQIQQNDLVANNFIQTAGVLDLNGKNISIVNKGSFSVARISATSLSNLGGRTITVEGSATFSGTSADSLDLNPGSGWTLAVSGLLTARYSRVANCNASVSSGAASVSRDAGGNVNWFFNVCSWDNGGGDNNWSTAANWNGDVVPADTDVVLILSGCGRIDFDASDTVRSMLCTPSSVGDTFNFNQKTLSVSKDADFRIGSNAKIMSAGRLEFIGAGDHALFSPASSRFSTVRNNSSGTTRLFSNSLRADTLLVTQGTFFLGSGLKDTITAVKGSGTLQFGSATLTLTGDSSDFSLLDSVIADSGTLIMSNSDAQLFAPHPNTYLYQVYKAGVAATTIQTNGLLVSNNLVVKSSELDLGTGLTHSVKKLTSATPSTGTVNFNASTLKITGDTADFTNILVTAGTGKLEFGNSSGNTVLIPRAAGVFPDLVQNAPGRITTVSTRPFRAAGLRMQAGTFVLGNFSDTATMVTGTGGSLQFEPSTILRIPGDSANFSGMASIITSTGQVEFTGVGNTQLFTPKAGATHPALLHSGNGTLRLSGTALLANSYAQTSGSLDFNGCDVSMVNGGGFSILSGGNASLSNLQGRTLSAEGNVVLNGVSGDSLNLNPSSPWTIDVDGGLTADYAVIGKSTALSGTGAATNSADKLGNNNWFFLNGSKAWDGGAGDNLWSSPANWTNNTLPTSSDTVMFASLSPDNCFLDVSDTVASILFTSGYAGTFDFLNDTLTLSKNSDFRSGGAIASSPQARIRFIGGSNKVFIPKSGAMMPTLEQNGACTTQVSAVNLRANYLDVVSGTFHLGLGLSDTVENVLGSGSVDFGTSALCVKGAVVDFSQLSAVSFGSNASLRFVSTAPQVFRPGAALQLPAVYQDGSGGTTLNGSIQANGLAVNSGALYLGSGNTHSVFSFSGGSSAGTLNFGTSTLKVSGTADFREPSMTASSGFLEFNGASGQTFVPRSGQTYPVLVQSGAGGTFLDSNVITKGFRALSGTLYLGTGRTHVADTLYGAGTIDFQTSCVQTRATRVDLSAIGQVAVSAGGSLEFISGTGTQVFVPRSAVTAPALRHTGNGILQFSVNDVEALSFYQSAGILDFNGFNLSVIGDLAVANGTPTSFTGLGGRTITVAGNAALSGSSGSLIGLHPGSGWTLAVSGGLTADYAQVGGCDASLTSGIAINSEDSLGNTNWNFAPAKIWDGGGANTNWSTAANWNNDVLPAETDLVLFNGTSGKNCLLDISDTVDHIIFQSGYVGTFSFGSSALGITGTADFTNAGGVIPGTGRLEFVGTASQGLTSKSSVVLPEIDLNNSDTVTLSGSLNTQRLNVVSGTLVLGVGLTHVAAKVGGNGTLDFSTSTLQVSGDSADMRSFLSIIPASGTFAFTAGSGATQVLLPKSGDTLPVVSHTGAGRIRLASADLTALGFSQTGTGALDFNGRNISISDNGDFVIEAGGSAVFENLAGRTLRVTGSATLDGQDGNLLNLNPASLCTLDVDGSLSAGFARVGNNVALGSTGLAMNSVSDGNNFQWVFEDGVVWDGEGSSNNWSNPQNWTGNSLPQDTDRVIFNSASVKNCDLDINAAVRHIILRSGYTGNLNFGDKTLSLTGDGDFRSGGGFSSGPYAVLEFSGSSSQAFSPSASAAFPDIIQSGSGSTTLQYNGLQARTLSVSGGTFVLGNNLAHSVTSLSGAGSMDFGTACTLKVTGSGADFGSMAGITPGTGVLRFSANSGTQTVTPRAGDTLPMVLHADSGALRVAARSLVCAGLNQSAGSIDLGGFNLNVAGNLVVTNGKSTTLSSLAGLTLWVSGSTSLTGTNGNPLALNPASAWTLFSGGALTASFASIGNSNASGTAGTAVNCTNFGGNTNWNFSGKVWDGGGSDTKWSTPANWTSDLAPTAWDSVIFSGLSVKDCQLDLSDTVQAILFDGTYAGRFDFSADTLTLSGNADFRSGGDLLPGTGFLQFLNTTAAQVVSKADDTLPPVIKRGAGTLTLASNPLVCGSVRIAAGTLDAGTGLAHLIGALSGSGALALNTSLIQSYGDTVNLSGFSSVTAGTGAGISFVRTTTQAYAPKSGVTLPVLTQNGAGGTRVSGTGIEADTLKVVSGTFDLNNGLIHQIKDLLGTSSGKLRLRASTLRVSGTLLDLSAVDTVTADSGVLELNGAVSQVLVPNRASHFRKVVQNGSGTLTLSTNSLAADTLTVSTGTVDLGSSDTLSHAIGLLAGAGSLSFNAAAVRTNADSIDFRGFAALNADSGVLDFIGNAGATQVLVARAADTLPEIRHAGAGTLRFSINTLTALGLTDTGRGGLDFNGKDVSLIGDFTILNGDTNTFVNAKGRTITVGGDASFAGQDGLPLNMDPDSDWTLAVTGSLNAGYADIANNTASLSAGIAVNSTDNGGNLNWSFGGKIWDGQGGDGKWSTPANWSGNTLPSNNDSVVFNNTSVASCQLDMTDTVRVVVFEAGYTGAFGFTNKFLSVARNADMRSGGDFILGTGLLQFTGAGPHQLSSNTTDTLPDIAIRDGGTLMLGTAVTLGDLDVDSGTIDLANGNTHTVTDVRGSGTLLFGSSTLAATGTSLDFSLLDSVWGGTGTLKFGGGNAQTFKPRASTVFPALIQEGAGGTTVATNGFTTGTLTVTSGAFNLGTGLIHDAGVVGGSASGTLFMGNSVLKVSSALDISSLGSVDADSATLEMTGTSAKTLKPLAGSRLMRLVQNGTGATTLTGALTADTIRSTQGQLHFGNTGLTHDFGAFAGAGEIHFGNSVVQTASVQVDLTGFATVGRAATAVLRLTGDTGVTQVLVPRAADSLPVIEHPNAGTLRLSTRALLASGLILSGGSMDFNGQDAAVSGDFLVTARDSTTFSGLAGRTIHVGRDASWSGQSGNRLNMDPVLPWIMAVAGQLNADFADIGNCTASVSGGTAIRSVDQGANYNWSFSGKTWDGGGADGKWTTAANWDGDVLPAASDAVIFTSSSSDDCLLDTSVSVLSIRFTSFYTGRFRFGGDTLAVSNATDLRSAGLFAPDSGALLFSGSASQSLYPHSSDTLPRLLVNSSDTVLVISGGFAALSLNIQAGAFKVPDSLVVSVTDLAGTGRLILGDGATLKARGASVNFAGLASVNASTASLVLEGALPQTLALGPSMTFNDLQQAGTGGATLTGNGVTVNRNLQLAAGTVLHLGAGLAHQAARIVCGAGSTIDFGSSVLTLTQDTVDFSPASVTAGTGTLIVSGNSSQILVLPPADTMPRLSRQGTGGLKIAGNGLATDSLIVAAGTVKLGKGFTHSINGIRGAGVLDFDTSVVEYHGTALDFSTFSSIDADSGTLRFPAAAGNQLLTPRAGDTLPFIEHTGAATLRFNGSLACRSLLQGKGTLDFNGFDLAVADQGDFTVDSGGSATLAGLAGRTLTVSGKTRLKGTAVSMLNLDPASAWNVVSTDSLIADYAVVGKSNAAGGSRGHATNCADSGGNINWDFPVAPSVGFTDADSIPAAQITQALDGSGLLTIRFRVQDAETNAVVLKSFEYSDDAGATWYMPRNADTSLSLAGGWPDSNGTHFHSYADFTGPVYSFTFGTLDADVDSAHSLRNTRIDSFRVRFKAQDTLKTSRFAVSTPFVLDNRAPVSSVNRLLSNDPTPVLTGRIDDLSAVLSVAVNGDTNAAVNNHDGTWTLPDDLLDTLPEGLYDVVVLAADSFGNNAPDTTLNELRIDLFAPIPTVDTIFTNDSTPALTGTVNDTLATVEVTVDGQTFTAVTNQDSTWILPDNTLAALAEGIYDVMVIATDTSGDSGWDVSTNELTVDFTPPSATVARLLTNDPTPALGGSVDDSLAAILVTVGGKTDTAVNNRNGTWLLPDDVMDSLVSGTYNVDVSATDLAGNTVSDITSGELRIDLVSPIVTASDVLTNDPAPALSGTVDDSTASLTVIVAGDTVAAVNHGNNTWALARGVLHTLAEGTYDVVVASMDSAGNIGLDATLNELRVDITAPVVTVNRLATADPTPRLTGTVNDSYAAVAITVDGQTLPAVNNGDNTWTLPDNALDTLAQGVYDVVAVAQDSAGNSGADATSADLTIDLSLLFASVDPFLTRDRTPPLTGTVSHPTATVEVTVNGQTVAALNNGDGTWVLADDLLDTLVDSTYDVAVALLDSVGHTGTDTTLNELVVDATPPLVSVYARLTNDPTPWLMGSVNDGLAAVSVTVNGQTLPAVNNLNGTWLIADDLLDTLADSAYAVIVTASDSAGNIRADSSDSALIVDLTPPDPGTVILLDYSGFTHDSIPALVVSAAGADSMRIALSEALLAGLPFTAYDTAALAPAFTAEGMNTVFVEFKDRAGNVQPVHALDSTVYDTIPPAVALLTPDSSTLWLAGQPRAVSWMTSDLNNFDSAVMVEYRPSPDSAWTLVADSLVDSGVTSWTVPADTGSAYQIRITGRDRAGNIAADSATFAVALRAGAPVLFAITPDSATVSSDSALQFSLDAWDKDSNRVLAEDASWSVIGAIGSVDTAGLFTASMAGLGFITAVCQGVTDTTDTIRVVPGSPVALGVTPDSGAITADSSLQFIATLFDADGNPVPVTPAWSLIGKGALDGAGLYTPDSAGTFSVAAAFGGLADTSGTFNVTGGRPVLLSVLPEADDTMAVHDTLRFTASAFDAKGNMTGAGTLAYLSLDTAVGKVDTTGLFTAVSEGKVRVVAMAADYLLSDTSGLVNVSGELLVPDSLDTLFVQRGAIRLTFPPGTLDSAIVVTIEIDSHTPLPQGFAVAGPVYRITPADLVFSGAVGIEFSADSARLIGLDSSRIRLFRYSAADSGWELVQGSVFDPLLGDVNASLFQFGILTIGVDTADPVAQNLSPRIVFNGTGPSLLIFSADNILDRDILLHYRQAGRSLWTDTVIRVRGDDSTLVQIAAAFSTARGFEYYYEISDGTNLLSSARFGVQVAVDSVGRPVLETPLRYGLFSVPLELDNDSVLAVLRGLGGYNPDLWKLFTWSDSSYLEFNGSNFARLASGRGYWLKVRDNAFRISTGSGRSVRTDSAFTLTLVPGWNIIGTPYWFNTDWSMVLALINDSGHDGQVFGPFAYAYRANGTGYWRRPFTAAGGDIYALDTWEGYMVKNISAETIRVSLPAVEYGVGGTKRLARIRAEYAGEWTIPIYAKSGEQAVFSVAGVHEKARPGPDRNDLPRPPAIEKELSVAFIHSAWKQGRGEYVADYRPVFTDGDRWDFVVNNPDTGVKVTELSFDLSSRGLQGWFVYLFDHQKQYAYPVEAGKAVAVINAAGKGARFTLLVGTMDYILRATEGRLGAPAVFDVSQNFPNPFNPSTSIRYQLAKAGKVEIDVYNVRGRVVSRIFNQRQAEGYYSLRWAGLDERRRPLASGIYFYRIVVKAPDGRVLFTKQRRMTLIK